MSLNPIQLAQHQKFMMKDSQQTHGQPKLLTHRKLFARSPSSLSSPSFSTRTTTSPLSLGLSAPMSCAMNRKRVRRGSPTITSSLGSPDFVFQRDTKKQVPQSPSAMLRQKLRKLSFRSEMSGTDSGLDLESICESEDEHHYELPFVEPPPASTTNSKNTNYNEDQAYGSYTSNHQTEHVGYNHAISDCDDVMDTELPLLDEDEESFLPYSPTTSAMRTSMDTIRSPPETLLHNSSKFASTAPTSPLSLWLHNQHDTTMHNQHEHHVDFYPTVYDRVFNLEHSNCRSALNIQNLTQTDPELHYLRTKLNGRRAQWEVENVMRRWECSEKDALELMINVEDRQTDPTNTTESFAKKSSTTPPRSSTTPPLPHADDDMTDNDNNADDDDADDDDDAEVVESYYPSRQNCCDQVVPFPSQFDAIAEEEEEEEEQEVHTTNHTPTLQLNDEPMLWPSQGYGYDFIHTLEISPHISTTAL